MYCAFGPRPPGPSFTAARRSPPAGQGPTDSPRFSGSRPQVSASGVPFSMELSRHGRTAGGVRPVLVVGIDNRRCSLRSVRPPSAWLPQGSLEARRVPGPDEPGLQLRLSITGSRAGVQRTRA